MSETIANTSPQRHANVCITAAKGGNDQLTGQEILTSLAYGPRCNEWDRGNFGSHLRREFLGGIYWALNIHEETASLPLATYGEEGREDTVAEALEVAMSPSREFCSRIRGRWLQVAGRDVTLWVLGKEPISACRSKSLTFCSFFIYTFLRNSNGYVYYGWTAP
jgi:hypothetical protein